MHASRSHLAFAATLVCLLLLPLLLPDPALADADIATQASAAPRELAILAFHRPPYYTFDHGVAGGILVDAVRRVLDAAHIPYHVTEMPPKRIVALFEQDPTAHACAPGWYRTREREQFARFSAPIYRNLPPVAVLRADAALQSGRARGLTGLLATGLRLVLRGGFSYGPALDEALARSRAPVYRSTADNAALLEMLASGRYDMTLMEQEEATELLRRSPRLLQALQLVPLTGQDALPGQPQTRHLMCGRGVDETTMRRIDDAIAAVLGDMPGDLAGGLPGADPAAP
ncbi:substrate-binding periplasmic protein [Nitratidesulfovibrio sp. SRB-5]|uniref:substrate-binding periplasmic protein n=1 Tax=Nitratidesulfovibrio sp. SRB-5 TaxID=2872636 RepID=UPI0010257AF7|nr:transporter substrate-binding domain-containing protein [Nitratidesulfovibrio sp. SRB-5]MBZ2171567.1 transporter substrate-binding domain-containing protein [Nitratidesulfovibrio sp. SRB-5]RXF76178.1 transporter substrate-binding domain-containing protein [Desulfovibrio sp. DS-1]